MFIALITVVNSYVQIMAIKTYTVRSLFKFISHFLIFSYRHSQTHFFIMFIRELYSCCIEFSLVLYQFRVDTNKKQIYNNFEKDKQKKCEALEL